MPGFAVVALAATFVTALAACTDNHSMSPWGDAGRPRLADYAMRPDLEGHVAEIEVEASRLGLSEAFRVTVTDPRGGDPLVAIALEGRDDVGRKVTATRVASPWGVVLARGPLDLRDVKRATATELLRVVALEGEDEATPGGAVGFGAFSDLTRDQVPDLVLRSEEGRLEIWSMTARAGTQIEVRIEAAPTRFVDVDGDGGLDLASRVSINDDALAPDLVDVATWAGDGFSNATRAARAFHARHRDWSRTAEVTAKTADERARRALEVAWHATLAGGDAAQELAILARKRPEGPAGESFDVYLRRIGRIAR